MMVWRMPLPLIRFAATRTARFSRSARMLA
jgi:hypothetical protein